MRLINLVNKKFVPLLNVRTIYYSLFLSHFIYTLRNPTCAEMNTPLAESDIPALITDSDVYSSREISILKLEKGARNSSRSKQNQAIG